MTVQCSSATKFMTNPDPLGGIGTDPVFNPFTGLFDEIARNNPDLWYNTTPAAHEMNQGGVPYGFQHIPLKGYDDGFPLVLGNVISGAGSLTSLELLGEGYYLSSLLSKTMTMEVLTYNARELAMGYMRGEFTWMDSGQIQMRSTISTLPTTFTGDWNSSSIPSYIDNILICVLILVYSIVSAIGIYRSIRTWRVRYMATRADLAQQQQKNDGKSHVFARTVLPAAESLWIPRHHVPLIQGLKRNLSSSLIPTEKCDVVNAASL
jgi:hypothetical protein